MSEELLFTPINIGGCVIKNRIMMAPMLMGFGTFNGMPTDKMMDYYEERAKGGAGLICTEITRVSDITGAGAFAQLSMSKDANIRPMQELAERIHSHGAKLFVQLHHPGRQNVGLLVGTVPLSIRAESLTKGAYGRALYKIVPKVGPYLISKDVSLPSVAPSKCPPAYFAGGHPRALLHKEIKWFEEDFVNAAVRVRKAGCDGVMLHASHGYLIQQFLSPYTNTRKDEYGGSLENRMRFLANIIEGIKKNCGEDFPITVRLTVDECYDRIGEPGRGYGLEEGIKIAKALEELGVAAIDVSCAGYDAFNYWLEPMSFEPGWRAYMAKAVKEAVNIPVLAANLIRSKEQAERQLEEGVQDMVSFGRPHIADSHLAEKMKNGGTVRRCICCLNCIESMEANAFSGSHGECALNPFVGNEGASIRKNGGGRTVVVAGAGPGGLTAAYLAALRGFKVIVLEKEKEAGGQLALAKNAPYKDKIYWAIEDLLAMCEEQGVEIRYSTEATAELIAELEPHAVICATGSDPTVPYFGGKYKYGDLLTFKDILSGRVKLENKRVTVAGSGMTGLETAEYLTTLGNKVTVVEMADAVAPGTWMQHVNDIMPRLKEAGVRIMTGEKLSEVYADHVVTESVHGKERTVITSDALVLALGSRPKNSLYKELEKRNVNSFNIGDSNKVGRIRAATEAAYNAVMTL